MTITERNIKLKHFITCLKCEIHGRECDDNCPTQYEAGNMGEIIENLEEISKALDQQPCEDAISRQAAIDAIGNYLKKDGDQIVIADVVDAAVAIGRLPSAQSEQRWIPCSERLPEESGRYLVSVLDGVGRRTTAAPYQPRYKAWTMTGRMAYWKVIAWMPLPEPYKEEQE